MTTLHLKKPTIINNNDRNIEDKLDKILAKLDALEAELKKLKSKPKPVPKDNKDPNAELSKLLAELGPGNNHTTVLKLVPLARTIEPKIIRQHLVDRQLEIKHLKTFDRLIQKYVS